MLLPPVAAMSTSVPELVDDHVQMLVLLRRRSLVKVHKHGNLRVLEGVEEEPEVLHLPRPC